MSSPDQLETPTPLATRPGTSLLFAVQFLTRIPVPALAYTHETLPRALPWFPLVGALLGGVAAATNWLLAPHLGRAVAATAAVLLLILLTGALHEDGLADCADAFGLTHSRTRTFEILHDSRIGTFGALALILSVGLRVLLVAALPLPRVLPVLVGALTLARWSVLPLALTPAAQPGQGAQIAGSMTRTRLIAASVLAFTIVLVILRWQGVLPVLLAATVVWLTGAFYRRRLGGVTGDCFGATIQLVECTVLLAGAWAL